MSKILIIVFFAVSVSLTFGIPVNQAPRAPVCEGLGHYFIAHESDCASYYVCYLGVLTRQYCSGALLWDASLNVCNYPDAVKCDGQGVTSPPATTTTTQRPTQGPTTVAPEEPQPTTAVPTTQAPPATTTTKRTTTSGPSPPEGDLPCPAVEFTYVAHPSDCARFYLCLDGSFQAVYPCGKGLWFSTSLQACVYPEKSDCQA